MSLDRSVFLTGGLKTDFLEYITQPRTQYAKSNQDATSFLYKFLYDSIQYANFSGIIFYIIVLFLYRPFMRLSYIIFLS